MTYLDWASTTKPSEAVVEIVSRTLRECWGNPSALYNEGIIAKSGIKEARIMVARVLGCDPEEIFFTSGASEGNNTVINIFNSRKNYIISDKIEHKSVLKPIQASKARKYLVGCDSEGVVFEGKIFEKLEEIDRNFADKPTGKTLVSIMYVNNVVGTLQPIQAIAERVKRYKNCYFHSDITQAIGHYPIKLHALGLDYATMSGHKFGAPKGVGILYVKKGAPLTSFIKGGGQENGFRAGTQNYPYIEAMSQALGLAVRHLTENNEKIARLYDVLIKNLNVSGLSYRLNGDFAGKNKHIVNISLKELSGETLQILLDCNGFRVGTGSSCSSGSSKPDYVLQEMHVPKEFINGSIRVTLSHLNTEREIEDFVKALKKSVETITHLSNTI